MYSAMKLPLMQHICMLRTLMTSLRSVLGKCAMPCGIKSQPDYITVVA